MLKDYKPTPFEYDHAIEGWFKINDRVSQEIKEAFSFPPEMFEPTYKFKQESTKMTFQEMLDKLKKDYFYEV